MEATCSPSHTGAINQAEFRSEEPFSSMVASHVWAGCSNATWSDHWYSQLFISARITSALQAFFARGVHDTQATSFVDL